MSNADELVARYILRQYREERESMRSNAHPEMPHLATCPDTMVEEPEANPALFYDTGVPGVVFTARLACPHGESIEWEYGELGDLPDILEDLEKEQP